ncbi:hypothetical protein ACLB1S_08640 [Escherichia coli]
MRLSAILLPVWIVFLFVAFKTLRQEQDIHAYTSDKTMSAHHFDESGFFNYCLNAPARERISLPVGGVTCQLSRRPNSSTIAK